MRDNIFFRAFEPNDYLLINKWRNDPKLQHLTMGTYKYVSSEIDKKWVEDKISNNKEYIYIAICLNDETKKMIGYLSLNDIDHYHKCACIGSFLIGCSEYQDGEILIEINKKMFDFGFNHLNMNRIETVCLEDHHDVRLSLEIFGMKLEGIKREALFKNGKYNNIFQYSILKREYEDFCNSSRYDLSNIIKIMREIQRSKSI